MDPLKSVNLFLKKKAKIELADVLALSVDCLENYPLYAWKVTNDAQQMLDYVLNCFSNSTGDQMRVWVELSEFKMASLDCLELEKDQNDAICHFFKKHYSHIVKPFSSEEIAFQTKR